VTFELGINYWPRSRAMYLWRDFDAGEVRDDMARIAGLGFDVVRLFALAEDFLPEPSKVSATAVGRLVEVVRAAGEAGLRAMPTLVVINMSGWMWWPAWMRDAQGRALDLFRDPAALAAQERLVETCARALAGGAAVRALDLANEIDGAQVPATREAGRSWVERMTAAARRGAPGLPVQVGAHLPSLAAVNNMRVDDIAASADEDVMHAYPLYSDAARSPLDPDLVPFSCALTAGLAGRGPVLMQEFGLPTAAPGAAGRTIQDDFLGRRLPQYLASEEEGGRYYAEVLERLVATGAAGAYAWCYADYDRRLFDRPPLDRAVRERTFGLLRADGSEKPAAEVFRRLRRERDAGALVSGAVPTILDLSADAYYDDPPRHFTRLYSRWLERAAA
jgi:endo-1,4-beta-mannosidase